MDKGTKFMDVLVYAAIDNQKDSTTYTSKIGMRTIAAYSGDSRSPIPMISVHSVDDLLYRRQS